jgi:hypothetical protein
MEFKPAVLSFICLQGILPRPILNTGCKRIVRLRAASFSSGPPYWIGAGLQLGCSDTIFKTMALAPSALLISCVHGRDVWFRPVGFLELILLGAQSIED